MTRSIINASSLATPVGPRAHRMMLQEKSPQDDLVIIQGGATDWRSLDSPSVDWNGIEELATLPSVIVAVIEGPLSRGIQKICEIVDLSYCGRRETCHASHTDMDVVLHHYDGTETTNQRLSRLETGIAAAGRPAIVAAALMRTQRDGFTGKIIPLEAMAYSLLQSGQEFTAWLRKRMDNL